jgi:hypothetical protein
MSKLKVKTALIRLEKRWCTKFCPTVADSTWSFIYEFLDAWDIGFVMWRQNCSPTSGFCTTTKHPCAQFFPSRSFNGKEIVILEPPLTRQISFLRRAQTRLIWRDHIPKLWKRFRKLTTSVVGSCKRMTAEVLRELEAALEFMYSCRRELIWRRPRTFAIQFTSYAVPSASTQSFYLIYRPRTVREGRET